MRSPSKGIENGIKGEAFLPIWRELLPRQVDNILSVHLFLEFEPQLSKSEELNNHGMKENRAFRIIFFAKKQ